MIGRSSCTIAIGAAMLALVFMPLGASGMHAFAQQDGPTAGPDASLSMCVSEESPRYPRYVLYKVEGEHVHFEGPYPMSKQEAAALLPLLQSRAAQQHGPNAKAAIERVSKPENCSFLYRPKGKRTLAMSEGSKTYVQKSRDEIIELSIGTPVTETVCLLPKTLVPSAAVRGTESALAYATNEGEACATAKRCLAEEFAWYSSPAIDRTCNCESSVGGLQQCTARPTRSKDTAIGVRG